MNRLEKEYMWEGIFAIGKGITYILFMAALIKYIIS
ncbi:hypothetical protein UFOVP242_229 [uncultured Caudovirales phage]|uniref:Uncharacterized protein n=1 Tax=uncultured Caudovirales phage TaxID=2100421 RepID=A0A6J7WYN5_9CAUD|nr:hypothetical protein UFOVP242_229 [uncultured Caudovirales phage]